MQPTLATLTETMRDIERDPRVGLAFRGKTGTLRQRPFFIAVEGRADHARHWDGEDVGEPEL